MPSVLPTISEITTRIKVIGRLTRNPVMICGEADGKTTWRIVFTRDKTKVRAVLSSTQSTLRTPSKVLSRIGQAQEKKITKIFIWSSKPKNSIATGIRSEEHTSELQSRVDISYAV